MASPAVRSSIVTNGTTASANAVVNLPATVSAGDTILVTIRNSAAGGFTFPGGGGVWNELFDSSADGATGFYAAAWKKADGSEGGTTITVTQTSSKFSACAWAIRDAADPTVLPPQVSTVAIGTTGQPNSTIVTPTGGSKDYLFGVLFGMEGEQTGVTTYPTNYTLGQLYAESGTAGAVTTNSRCGGAFRQATAASEDPGAWTIAGTLDDSSAYTIAFHPTSNVEIELGGVAATVAAGLLGVALAAAASGTQATTAVGSMAPVQALTGVSATCSVGSVSVGVVSELAATAYSLITSHAQAMGEDGGTTSSFDSTGGNLIVCGVSRYFNGGGISVSDNKGNTYTPLTEATTGDTAYVRIFYAENATCGSGHTVTATGIDVFIGLALQVWSGANTSGVFDQQNTNGGNLLTSVQPGSVTPSEANALVVTALSNNADASDVSRSIDGGFSISGQKGAVASTSIAIALASLVQTAAVAANPTWSWSGVQNANAAIATFKPAVGGGSGVSSTASVGDLTSSRTIALTGVSATASVGTITADTGGGAGDTYALTGNAAPATPGSVSPNVSIALTGNGSTATVGSLSPTRAVPVIGISSTASVGTVAPARAVAVTGASSTAAVGSVTRSASLALSGQASTAAVGTIASSGGTPEGEINLALTGNAATASIGSITTDRTLALTGAQATGIAGSVTVGNRSFELSGNAASATIGDVVPEHARPLTGLTSTAAVGSLTRSLSVELAGLESATSVGMLVSSGGDTGPLATADWIVKMPADDAVVQFPADDYVVRMPV